LEDECISKIIENQAAISLEKHSIGSPEGVDEALRLMNTPSPHEAPK
jgi:hypothetical protein